MLATPTRAASPIASTGPLELLNTVAHLREAAADLRTALDFDNVPGLYAMRAEWLRDRYTDLDELLAQLGAMRVQLAEYVRTAEDSTRTE